VVAVAVAASVVVLRAVLAALLLARVQMEITDLLEQGEALRGPVEMEAVLLGALALLVLLRHT
jgi:hypothetical protein